MPVPLTARARLGRASHAHLTAQLGRCIEGVRSLRPARPAVLSRATVAFPLGAGHCWGRGDSADDRSQDSTASLALGTLGRTRPSHGRRSRGSVWPHVTAGVSRTPWPRLAGTAGREDGHPGSTRGARGARTGDRRGCRACLRRRVGLGERPGPPRGRVGQRPACRAPGQLPAPALLSAPARPVLWVHGPPRSQGPFRTAPGRASWAEGGRGLCITRCAVNTRLGALAHEHRGPRLWYLHSTVQEPNRIAARRELPTGLSPLSSRCLPGGRPHPNLRTGLSEARNLPRSRLVRDKPRFAGNSAFCKFHPQPQATQAGRPHPAPSADCVPWGQQQVRAAGREVAAGRT